MFRIKTNLTQNTWEEEYNSKPSLTRPDMNIPLATLLDRHRRGIQVPQFEPEFSDEDFPDFKTMDLAELQEYREDLADQMLSYQQQESELAKRIKEEHSKIQEYNIQKRIKEEVEKTKNA